MAEWLVRLTVVWEDPGSNHAADSCVYRDSCCDYTLENRLCTFTAVLRSTQPFTLHRTVKWVSAYGLMAMVDVDVSCQFSADSQPKSTGLVWVLATTRCSVCIHQMNQVNSRNDFGHDDSTINIVVAIIIVMKRIGSRLPPFCKQNLLFIQPRWQLRRTYLFNHYNVLF